MSQSKKSHSAKIQFYSAEVVAVRTRYIRGKLKRVKLGISVSGIWSLDLEQPWLSDKDWSCSSGSELRSPSDSDLRSASYSMPKSSTEKFILFETLDFKQQSPSDTELSLFSQSLMIITSGEMSREFSTWTRHVFT